LVEVVEKLSDVAISRFAADITLRMFLTPLPLQRNERFAMVPLLDQPLADVSERVTGTVMVDVERGASQP
jgi:hypothetical protein